jgi:D-inositol-3-phosphate glycosyltransferase
MLAVRHASSVIVASEHMREDLADRRIPRSRIHYIPYGIDTERFAQPVDNAEVKDELGIPRGAPCVGLVGRIHPWKGHSVLIAAAPEILRVYPDVHFLLVGDVAFPQHLRYREALDAMIREAGIEAAVRMVGTRSDIPAVMRALDVCAVPSLREPFGLVAIEAQAAGTAVVASRVGGLAETVVDNVTGRLVSPGDSRGLAQAIVQLLSDPASRHRMAEKGQQRVQELFSLTRMAAQTQTFYDAMCALER